MNSDHEVHEFPGRLAGYDVLMSPDPMEPPMVKMSRFLWLKERLPQDVSGQQIGLETAAVGGGGAVVANCFCDLLCI